MFRQDKISRIAPTETMEYLIQGELAPDRLRTLYPLVRQLQPEVGPVEWLRRGRAMMRAQKRRPRGIVAVRYPGQRFPCGMMHYSLGHDLVYGGMLIADHIVAMDFLRPARIVQALLAHLETVAFRLRCQELRVIFRDGTADPACRLSVSGFRYEGAVLRKGMSRPLLK